MKKQNIILFVVLLYACQAFSQITPVIIPATAQNVFSNIAIVKEMNVGMGNESGELEVPVKKGCGADEKGKCLLGATILIMDKLGFEQYKQYTPDLKKGIEQEYNTPPSNIILKRCCLKFEEFEGGTLATWTETFAGIGEGDMPNCEQKIFRWHAYIGYTVVDLSIIIDGDNDGLAKKYLSGMIAQVKKK